MVAKSNPQVKRSQRRAKPRPKPRTMESIAALVGYPMTDCVDDECGETLSDGVPQQSDGRKPKGARAKRKGRSPFNERAKQAERITLPAALSDRRRSQTVEGDEGQDEEDAPDVEEEQDADAEEDEQDDEAPDEEDRGLDDDDGDDDGEDEEDSDDEDEEEQDDGGEPPPPSEEDEFVGSDYQPGAGPKPQGVFVPKWGLQVTDNGSARIVLAQVAYWLGAKENGKVRTWFCVECDGFRWLRITYAKLGSQVGFTKRQARNAVANLVAERLLVVHDDKDAGHLLHLRPSALGIEAKLAEAKSPAEVGDDDETLE